MFTHIRLFAAILFILSFTLLPTSSRALALLGTYNVNDPGDAGLANPLSTSCVTASGDCTLRAAIQAANNHAGPDAITFSNGVALISPATNLPAFSTTPGNAITLDATSTPITLDGSGIPNDSIGLNLAGDGHKVKGINIQYFNIGILVSGNLNTVGGTLNEGCMLINNDKGIRVEGNYTTIAGNRVGINKSGISSPNGHGIELYGDQNTVGTNGDGTNDNLEYNLIAGNSGYGIDVYNGSINNNIAGNYIGIKPDGGVVPNGTDGVFIRDGPNRVGSNGDGISDNYERNVISGNTQIGIHITRDSDFVSGVVIRGNYIGVVPEGNFAAANGMTGITIVPGTGIIIENNVISGNAGGGMLLTVSSSTIRNNWIGTNMGGTLALSNGYHGIHIQSNSDNNTISGNVIAYNGGDGIWVRQLDSSNVPNGNRLEGNSIYNNTELGIDLEPIGKNSIDPGDGDSGPNNLQNFPEIIGNPAYSAANPLVFEVPIQFNSTYNATFSLTFYRSPACDPSGYGEGKTYLGQRDVTTPGSGDLIQTISLGYVHVPQNEYITALATAADGSTSEFSPCSALTRFTGTPPANVKQVFLPALSK